LETFKNILNSMKAFWFISSCLSVQCCFSPLLGTHSEGAVTQEKSSINKLQIIYLAQSKNYRKAIELYTEYCLQNNVHDFDILEHLAKTMLEHGARSPDPQSQILSIYSCNIAGLESPYDILDAGISSSNPQTQLASLQFLARMQDDQIDTLLQKAMASEFLYTRLEAAYILCSRKSRSATGQVEALMHKLPPQISYFFPELFALIGTSDAVHILRKMMDDRFYQTRIEAILSAARHGRDDLLPTIRSCATHVNIAEQEACASALGFLKDSSSIKRLKKLSLSPAENVQLAALRSLHMLGDESAKQKIIGKAQEDNLFAIALLGEISGSESVLYKLAQSEDLSVRFNASFSLLRRKDPRSVSFLKEFLLRDSRELGFQPSSSIGNSLRAWKVISSLQQHAKQSYLDLMAITLSVRETLLKESLELPEESFLKIAQLVLDTKQNELIPLLVSLIENMQSPRGIELLKLKSQTAGAPLIRAYCNLALFRLKEQGPYEENVKKWITSKQNHEMIQFRPTMPWATRISESFFELTPEESSSLLIESYQSLAERHTQQSIEFILQSIALGDPRNVPVLAGILLKAIQ